MRIYLAGPMRGYVDNNFPAFHEAADRYRKVGFEVVSPAEMDLAIDPDAANVDLDTANRNFAFYMTRDLPAVLECDAIVLLEGWEDSVGALTEAYVAWNTRKDVFVDRQEEDDWDEVDPGELMAAIVSKFVEEFV